MRKETVRRQRSKCVMIRNKILWAMKAMIRTHTVTFPFHSYLHVSIVWKCLQASQDPLVVCIFNHYGGNRTVGSGLPIGGSIMLLRYVLRWLFARSERVEEPALMDHSHLFVPFGHMTMLEAARKIRSLLLCHFSWVCNTCVRGWGFGSTQNISELLRRSADFSVLWSIFIRWRLEGLTRA